MYYKLVEIVLKIKRIMNQSEINPKSMKKCSEENVAPNSNVDVNKDKMLNVRLTFNDFARVAESARQSGLNVSEWSRRVLTKNPVKKVRANSPVNRQIYVQLSNSLLEFSELFEMLKRDNRFEGFRDGVVERTLVKINAQVLEVKRRLL